MTDIDVVEFATLLETLEDWPPITEAFDTAHPQPRGVWWLSQREHMVVWFDDQVFPDHGNPTRSARLAYSRLAAPGALLWIAEAIGVPTDTVQAAADSAASAPPRHRPAAIRQIIPWELIYQHTK